MRNVTLWFIIFMVLTSCAVPAPVVKLIPSTLENKDYWNMGQQFVYANDKNVWFDCAFNRVDNGRLVFDVKVNNQSDSAILVDPALFSQISYKNDSLKLGQSYAYDPEVTLTNFSLNENKANAEAKNAAVLGLCSALLSAGANVAVAVSKKDDEKKQQLYSAINATNELVQVTTAVAAESADIRAEGNWNSRKSLSEMFLRKTTLPKGYFIDGEVHFPYYNQAKWFDIILVSEKSKAVFLFRHKLIYPEIPTVYNFPGRR